MKKITLWLLVLTVILSTFSAFMVVQAADNDYEIVMVVKLEGVAWFDNMRLGIKQFTKDTRVNACQIGADTADPASQVALIEDLIAKGVEKGALPIVAISTYCRDRNRNRLISTLKINIIYFFSNTF